MVFSSYLFLFYFLPAALAVYYVLPRRGQNVALTLLSYVFYGWANPLFVLVMFASTVLDYACGLVLAGQFRAGSWRREVPILDGGGPRTRLQKTALAITVCSNLALLGFFKHFNFGVENYDAVVEWLGLPQAALGLSFRVLLPLGISFYTFQAMSYGIDVYRGDAHAIRNFIDFACYVSMFPQLVAGPIIRFQEVAGQLRRRTCTAEKFARGSALVALGLAKKVLLANPCGRVADAAFDAGSVGCLDSWVGAAAYAFQIYFDFSGYSDMAVGLGLMLGFVFAKNFDSPYRSQSITEFWRRWHLSLSSWLRDYLYLPLGGNRRSEARTYFNLAAVMLLGGLWHGAAWTFLIWGGMHGAMLIIERLRDKTAVWDGMPAAARTLVTFVILLFTWVFFRSADMPAALGYCRAMLGLGDPGAAAGLVRGIMAQPYYVGTLTAAAFATWALPQAWDWTRTITWPKAAAILALFWVSVIVLTTQAYNPFIYFIF
ncbi:MAG: MBOAT family protein [Planctomycetes bacterium]|nr:MBOAT family protein [Planctomycetota bacterium]